MNIKIPKGKYIIAVSGGVDSVVLLDLLSKSAKEQGLFLIVAHFDHGIRQDSSEDALFVAGLAKSYKLPFETKRVELGAGASEESARNERYQFLVQVKNMHEADGIIIAHHQNDVIETMAINSIRGTSPRGLVSLKSSDVLLRPLLDYPKKQIIDYAVSNGLLWREDSTNSSPDYLRNRIRAKLNLSDHDTKKIVAINKSVANSYKEIDSLIEQLKNSVMSGHEINRSAFAQLPFTIGSELLARTFTNLGVNDVDNLMVTNANIAIRTLKPTKKFILDKYYYLLSEKNIVRVEGTTI